MDLTGVLLRCGAARPHVLTATLPGGTAVRLAVEEQLRRRGWPEALSPADADVLAVAGTAAADIGGALEQVWAAIPAPRARADASHPGEVAAALDAARAELGSADRRRHTAADRHRDAGGAGGHSQGADQHATRDGGHTDSMGGGEGHDMSAMGMPGTEMPDMEMAGMGMAGMGMPAGLPMARLGADRDGLKLDRLHVPLGPFLPDWPAGLVVRVTIQGDVVQQAEVTALGAAQGGGSFWAEPWLRAAAGEPVTTGMAARRRAAAHLDSLGRLLAVAGWGGAAVSARRLRDATLSGVPASRLRPGISRLARRVTRSRVLAWSTRGIGVLAVAEAATVDGGAAQHAAGDVTARYRRWCSDLARVAAFLDDGSPLDTAALEPPRGLPDGGRGPSAGLLAALPRLLEGAELAAARLIIASLDPDVDELAAGVEAGRGG